MMCVTGDTHGDRERVKEVVNQLELTENDILNEIYRIKDGGFKIKKLSNTAINKLRIEANKDTYFIENEGLYSWVFMRVVER